MKSKVTAGQIKGFRPFTLTIEVDSLEEAYALRALKGNNNLVASAAISANQMRGRDPYGLATYYSEVFLPVERELLDQGFPT